MHQGWKGSDMLNNRWVNKLALTKSHLLELHGPKELIPNWPEQCARSASVAVLEGHCWAVFRVQWWSSAIAGGCSYCWRYLFETTDDCFPDCYSFLHTLEDVWWNTSNNSKKTKNKNKKNPPKQTNKKDNNKTPIHTHKCMTQLCTSTIISQFDILTWTGDLPAGLVFGGHG